MIHDLLLAKLHALNFDMNALNLIFDYLTGKNYDSQPDNLTVKINSSFSSNRDMFQGFLQGSILGPLLLFFVGEADIMSYADDNTPYVCSKNVGVTLEKIDEVGKVKLDSQSEQD